MENFFREIKNKIQFKKSNKLNFPPHIHDDIELIYITSGSSKAFCDGKEYFLQSGDFFLVFPNQVHSYSECSLDCEFFLIIINPSLLTGYSSIFSEKIPVNAVYNCKNDNDNLLKIIHIAYDEFNNSEDKRIAASILTAVFGKLLNRYYLATVACSNDSISTVLQYCSKHYKEELSVKMVAEELFISQSHISHVFNQKLKISFRDYINSLRLSDSVRLLKNKEYSLTQIAYLSGFTTIRTFNRAFLKRYGLTPSKYRSNNL